MFRLYPHGGLVKGAEATCEGAGQVIPNEVRRYPE